MASASPRRREAGFTLIETMIVVAIIGIMAAISIPQILNYMRHFRIRGAIAELGSGLNQARMRAITKSAQHGVVFATQNNTTYWIHIEDDQGPLPRQGLPETLNVAVPDTAQSTRFRLPPDVVFATAVECTPNPAIPTPPYAVYAPTTQAVRFGRLGGTCVPGTPGCAAMAGPPVGLANFLQDGGTYVMFCLRDTRNGLSRWVAVSRGGKVEAQR